MYGEKITIACLQCGSEFRASKSIAEKRGFKFCSPACASKARQSAAEAKRPIWTCEACGKQFKRRHERKYPARFCSQACQGEHKTGRTRADAGPLIEKPCAVCGKQMRSRVASKTYCSKECQQARMRTPKHAIKPCEYCQKLFKPQHGGSRFCSRKCLYAGTTGEKSASWAGGRYIRSDGYACVYAKDHHAADGMGYVKEHRYVMEQLLGRPLRPGENVHHKNGKRDDNSRENLELWIKRQPPGQRVEDVVKWARQIIKEYGALFPETEV